MIRLPPYDIHGNPRPSGIGPIELSSGNFRKLVKSFERRKSDSDPAAVAKMENYFWRQAHRALGLPIRGRPSPETWQKLLEEIPPSQTEAPLNRAEMRRRALIYHGLRKSTGSRRPLSSSPTVRFGRKTWQPVEHEQKIPRFSPFKLDYYYNTVALDDPKQWIEPDLYKRLIQRGLWRSPKAKRTWAKLKSPTTRGRNHSRRN